VSRSTLSLMTAFNGRERDVHRCSRRGGWEIAVTSEADSRSTFSRLVISAVAVVIVLYVIDDVPIDDLLKMRAG